VLRESVTQLPQRAHPLDNQHFSHSSICSAKKLSASRTRPQLESIVLIVPSRFVPLSSSLLSRPSLS
jgi:hypothetical protein